MGKQFFDPACRLCRQALEDVFELSPAGVSRERLEAILGGKEMPYDERRIAA
jgi:hypothetical protein